MSDTRVEKDSLGEIEVPVEARWGAQTQRAVNNFPISGRGLPARFIQAVVRIKRCAAQTNADLELLDEQKRAAIVGACNELLDGHHLDQFPVDVFQTGSGTSTNMNVNEVVAHLCREAGTEIHPNDDVNLGQSSNDTIPTALHLSSVMAVTEQLLPDLEHLIATLGLRAGEGKTLVKTGRTHLMDAMPVTVEQELRTWVLQLQSASERLARARDDLQALPQGGTAVGTGINADPRFAERFAEALADDTGRPFTALPHPALAQSAVDAPLHLSAALRGLAVVLMKISNDLRWMNSGPIHGLGELQLPATQPGSSIMPGKVNPVICESATMVAAQVIGLDQANTVAAQSGNFQLNVMLPLVATNLLDMTEWLANSCRNLADQAIHGMTWNKERLAEGVGRNPILVTALNPVIGYEKAAAIAKEAFASGRAVIDVAAEHTDLGRDELEKLLDPLKLTGPSGS
ncbi:MAG: class II fumarate hydratase [Alcanivorax sp.]|uniref:Fumarate hydratase class II n=1 Tax=Alloalcanivorax marinus TaxID=1177169 RepID=A0A9Q3UJN2_9GAMM|nr:class II fumarate hydratase [Alloalcanivorax marinus]MBM7332190.1 class II fumarate hydratase [Alloalcanivorax marinus]MCC4307445.1 class II fumarate hydratase [Alloalcanivorax marinus]MCU5785229.1 fumarate hydratase [Alloalcanivorax marinus]